MLSENQVKRLLKYCENINIESEKKHMCGNEGHEYFEYMRNIGWCQALRLVLERDTYPISKNALKEDVLDGK